MTDPTNTELPADGSEFKPIAVRIGLWLALGLLSAGAVYLYSVRGTAILLDLSSGIAGLLCL